MMSTKCLLGCLVLASRTSTASAFAIPFAQRTAASVAPTTMSTMTTTALQTQRLSEIDEMCIENVAEYCLKAENALENGECDIEEYQALVNQLRDQRAILAQHVDYVDSLLTKLQAATDGGDSGVSTAAEESKQTYFAG